MYGNFRWNIWRFFREKTTNFIGLFFEYAYVKFVCKKIANVIFTDQSNTGNAGYKNVDYVRKYTLSKGTDSLILYVSGLMTKILDFDNFVISNKDYENFYYSESDIGGENIQKFASSCGNQIDANAIVKFLNDLKIARINNTQMTSFFDIVRECAPRSYFNPINGNIKEYKIDCL